MGELGEFKSNGVDKLSRPDELPVNLLNYMDVYNRRSITNENCNELMQVTAKPAQKKDNNVLENDVFFTPTSETADDIGHVMVIEETLQNTVYSYHLMRYRPYGGSFYKTYPNYACATNSVRHQMALMAQGVQRFVLSKNQFENISIMLPESHEQEKIASLLTNIDNLITLHQRKCDKLQSIKKSFLQRMFPAQGEDKPKIRFSGFTEPWEQRKLEDVGTTFTGLSGKTASDFGHGDASFITYMNVFSNPVSDPTMVEHVEIDSKQREVEVGDVFFTTSSETPEEVGMSSVLKEKCGVTYLNSFCFGFRPTEKFNLDYLAFMLRSESVRSQITLLAQGISRFNISKTKMMDIYIPVPRTDEQILIGKYFSQLDNLITLHQRKCENLKNIKKAMLQKMFI